MNNLIKPRLDFLIEQLKKDFDLIAKKKKMMNGSGIITDILLQFLCNRFMKC